ncbi:unannotated protein [freshwater metagenome]|uniref:Unannotated protein n=1 Tax=freshwater metagenome TaxID=449393 RepID=A0A6J7GLG8_9ZZZZ
MSGLGVATGVGLAAMVGLLTPHVGFFLLRAL